MDQVWTTAVLLERHILLAPTIHIYDGQVEQTCFGNWLNLCLQPWYIACFIVGTSRQVVKFKPTGWTKYGPQFSWNGIYFWLILYTSMMGQVDQTCFGKGLNLGLQPVYIACFIIGTSRQVVKFKPTGWTKYGPRFSWNGIYFWLILYTSMMDK